jgi:hypothetical protein
MKSPAKCKRILLMHMRKAGGTTARRVLTKIAQIHGVEFQVREGYALSQDDLDEETLVIINLRHPFARTCSLFNDQGVWRGHDMQERERVFDAWLAGNHSHRGAPPLWFLPRNLYVRSMSNCRQTLAESFQDSYREMTHQDYQAALANLRHIDLVWICDWLKFKPYCAYLSSRLLGPGKGLINFPHYNQTASRHNFDIRQELQPQQIEAVRQANRWDTEFYQYACWQEAQAAAIQWPGVRESSLSAIPGV